MIIVTTTLNYMFVLILSYLGVPIGTYLGMIAKEELKVRKYYNLLKFFILLVIEFYFLLSFVSNLFMILFLILIIAITLFVAKIPDSIVFVLLSLIFFWSAQNQVIWFAESILIFLVGMPMGTLYARNILKKHNIKFNTRKFKKDKNIIKDLFLKIHLYYVWYLLIAVLMFFVSVRIY